MKELRLEKFKWLAKVTVMGCTVSSKICFHLEPANVNLFGREVFADLINSVLMRLEERKNDFPSILLSSWLGPHNKRQITKSKINRSLSPGYL